MMLRSSQVRAQSAEIYGYILENARTSLPLDLYWNILVTCQDVEDSGETLSCSVLCDWLCWPVKNLQQMAGMTLKSVRYPKLVEGSLYLADHHTLRLSELTLQQRGGGLGLIVKGNADVRGMDSLDGKNIPVEADCALSFTGVTVGSDLVGPQADSDTAARYLARFFDPTGLLSAQRDKGGYIFTPRV
ncbi:MAG: hypothetical protein ACTHPD_05080 [Rhizomicrobium sp.]